MPRTLLAVDGNALIHRAFHAQARTAYRRRDGRPGWAVRGLLEQLVAAVDRSCADAVVVGFDDPDSSLRREEWPTYKAQRPDKLENLQRQLADAMVAVERLGVPVVVPPGLEADDVLASCGAQARNRGWQTVIATSDRDAFALIDESTRVLRIINGGVGASPMLDPGRLLTLTGVGPAQYRDLAALRGDPADNLPGITGIGPTLGSRLLAEFGSAAAIFDDAGAGGDRCRSTVGKAAAARLAEPEARATWERNVRIMTMRTDVRIPEHLFDSPTLPLAPAAVAEVFDQYDLLPRNALLVLCDMSDGAHCVDQPRDPRLRVLDRPDVVHQDVDPSWTPAPARRARFRPLPRPRHLQDTLF